MSERGAGTPSTGAWRRWTPIRITTAIVLAASISLIAISTSSRASALVTGTTGRNGAPGCSAGTRSALDATLDGLRPQLGAPGLQAAVIRDGRLVWSGTRGTAIESAKTPVDRQTVFAFASFGKTFLAAYALHLVDAHRLDLDRPISKYVGDSVAGSDVVTVRMLLAHTSGYPDVYESAEVGPLLAEQYDPNRAWTFAAVAAGIHEPVDPGARWEYSNTGFIVLAHVLDAVTARPLEHSFPRFAARAGVDERDVTMRRSAYALQHIAHGYTPSGATLTDSFEGATGIPTDLYGLPWGDGAFAGTARGAARFLDALFVQSRLLRPRSVRAMTTPTPQSLAAGPSGQMQSYAMGAASYQAAGRAWQGHDGTYVGLTSMGASNPRLGLTVAVLTNRQLQGRQPAIEIWRALAETATSACGGQAR